MKKVYTLYRVSTKKQLDCNGDDIPMQRIACQEYVAKTHPDWSIIREYEEKGVSGYKVRAKDRDAIVKLLDAAKNREFDVLLVFMFDRIGRLDDETPFIVQAFIGFGVEVWSVKEGQRVLQTSSDRLINYMCYWNAQNESAKTSERVKTKLQQMTSSGIFTGGCPPFGYKLVDQGRLNAKGKSVKDLVIDEAYIDIVKSIFDKFTTEGKGTYQIAAYLNDLGFRTRKGTLFKSGHIVRILKNECYRGFIVSGDARSDRLPKLQVVSDKTFFMAAQMLEARQKRQEEEKHLTIATRRANLLGGNIYCGHCGHSLVSNHYSDVYVKKDGTKTKRDHGRYICYHKSRKLSPCDGQSTYWAERIDDAVLDTVRNIFAHIMVAPEEDEIQSAYKYSINLNKKAQRDLESQMSELTKNIAVLREEIGKALMGKSVFSPQDLANELEKSNNEMQSKQETLEKLKEKAAQTELQMKDIIPSYRQLRTWMLEFDECSYEAKRVIVNHLFDRIEVSRGYKIHCVMNVTYRQFCDEWLSRDSDCDSIIE